MNKFYKSLLVILAVVMMAGMLAAYGNKAADTGKSGGESKTEKSSFLHSYFFISYF